MSDVEVRSFASDIEELAQRLNGRVIARVTGESWEYALIRNDRAMVLCKYSPRSKRLFLRGLIAIPFEDFNKVVRMLDNYSKDVVKELLKKLSEKYGVELNVK